MIEKLKAAEERYEEIGELLSDPEVIGDNKQYASLMKEYKNLTPIIDKYIKLHGGPNTRSLQ